MLGFLFFLAMLVLVSACFVLPIRLTLRFVLKKWWSLWYVKRAVDASIAGFFCLIVAFIIAKPTVSSVSEDLGRAMNLDHAELSVLFFNYKSDPNEAFDSLIRLQTIDFFVENFFQFVLLPPLLIGLFGYFLQRQEEQKGKSTQTLIETSMNSEGDVILNEEIKESVSRTSGEASETN